MQFTDSDGDVTFKTVFPGGYAGRATHIHYKFHGPQGPITKGLFFDNSEFTRFKTGQLYFPDELVDLVHELDTYNNSTDIDLDDDHTFDGQGLISDVQYGETITASITIHVDTSLWDEFTDSD